MLEVLIDNKNGNIWDITNIISEVSWSTSRIGKPGKLDMTLIKHGLYQDNSFQYSNGDVIRVRKGNTNVFYGYIFAIDESEDEAVRITCYDQIRYLLTNDTYVFSNITATDIVRKIASDFNLNTGLIDDTQYLIPTMVEDGKQLIDIICKALTLTLINTHKNYFLFDDFGSLSVRKSEDMLLDFVIGDNSLLTNYSSKKSIDSDTYNIIKIYRNNNDTKKRDIHISQDSANIAKWGMLQLYQSADENMNEAQIQEMLTNLAILKNRETRSLKIDALGDIRVRAGCYIPIIIEERNINQPFLIEECVHRLDSSEHTMSLDLVVI